MTIVCKIGGSLLKWPGIADRLRQAVHRYEGQPCLILVGGGASADVVRDWSQIHGLDDETAHWLAIASLDLSRDLIAGMLGFRSVSSRSAATSAWNLDPSPLLLEIRCFTQAEEAESGRHLPHTWDVTSDSLAAWTAIQWPATELVLFKSISAPKGLDATQASEQGLVDRHFPLLAERIPLIKWCNLRASTESEPWLEN